MLIEGDAIRNKAKNWSDITYFKKKIYHEILFSCKRIGGPTCYMGCLQMWNIGTFHKIFFEKKKKKYNQENTLLDELQKITILFDENKSDFM